MASDNASSVHFHRRRQLLLGAAAATVLPWAGGLASCGSGSGKGPLVVGGLPVTCNLTLPIACEGKAVLSAAAGLTDGHAFEYSKYSGWPEIKESLMAGRIQAAYMLAPLIMDLADKNLPLKVVSLGHRSGAVIMVGTESPYHSFRDLKGKRVAIPSRFAVDFLFLRKLLARENMSHEELEIIEMPPPDMPAALYAKAVDAYCTGEPFGAAAQQAGYARPLFMTRDEWPKYICCVLTVRGELIAENRPLVQDLVNHVMGAGVWLDMQQANRDKAVAIAAGKKFFNQDPKILQFVMENPTDRVTYGDMKMVREEFEDLMRQSVAAGTLKRPVAFETYVDESFVKNAQPVAIPL
jgi:NitT/TauT family transport system substrate-binding protein